MIAGFLEGRGGEGEDCQKAADNFEEGISKHLFIFDAVRKFLVV